MLNWRIEEKVYIKEKIYEYLSKIPALARIFISEKQMNKKINYISDQASLEFRRNKLDSILDEVEEERNRINALIDDMNNKFDNYISKQQHIISKNIRPFEIEVKPYDNLGEPTLSRLEVVSIKCEPFELAFIQENIDKGDD